MRFELGLLISLLIWVACSSPALGQFEITYYDNYNYDDLQWDAWQSVATPLDAWDYKYLATESSGKTVFTDHAFESIDVFDLRGGLFSKDGHATAGEDWNPLESIGDDVSGQSPHHVFAALFTGLVYFAESDFLEVASDDDVYIFLDNDTAWGDEILSVPKVSFFETDSMVIPASLAGYHTITVKYIERRNVHSGIQINLNDLPLEAAKCPGTPGYWKNHPESWLDFAPDEPFSAVFGAGPDIPLLQVLKTGGGGVNALARHAVAALLNADHPDIVYPMTEVEIIVEVANALDFGDPDIIEDTKDMLDEFNNLECPDED